MAKALKSEHSTKTPNVSSSYSNRVAYPVCENLDASDYSDFKLSPALELQRKLVTELHNKTYTDVRWSYRRTALLLFFVCSSFWSIILFSLINI